MLQEELKKVKSLVDEFLRIFFEGKRKKLASVDKEAANLVKEIADITLRGGDRFRPFMVWLGAHAQNQKSKSKNQNYKSKFKNNKSVLSVPCESVNLIRDNLSGEKKENALIKIMAAIELLHSFALIHDDVMDSAATRRGGPTIQPPNRAILAGDLCFTFADELLNGAPLKVKEVYDELREEVIIGQHLDVLASKSKIKNQKSKIRKLLFEIYEFKTARYTFWRPFEMGMAAVGGYSERSEESHLKKILIQIGAIFQMRDDYLDLFGDEKKFGKKIGGDLKEGKLTIWHEKAMRRLGKSGELGRYGEIWGKKNTTREDIDWVKTQMEKLGIKKEIEEEMKEISEKAVGELREIREIREDAKKLLIEMAEFVITRKM